MIFSVSMYLSFYILFVVLYKGYICAKAREDKNLLKNTREIIHGQYEEGRKR
jgi:hypothetical protein